MILVDSSVWIDYFNNVDSAQTTMLDESLIAGTTAIGDLIYLEILQGFRHNKDYKKAKIELAKLDIYEMFGHHMVEPCAKNFRTLRKKGITIRSTTDVIIGTFCMENKLPLLFRDKDFLPFTKHLGLLSVV